MVQHYKISDLSIEGRWVKLWFDGSPNTEQYDHSCKFGELWRVVERRELTAAVYRTGIIGMIVGVDTTDKSIVSISSAPGTCPVCQKKQDWRNCEYCNGYGVVDAGTCMICLGAGLYYECPNFRDDDHEDD